MKCSLNNFYSKCLIFKNLVLQFDLYFLHFKKFAVFYAIASSSNAPSAAATAWKYEKKLGFSHWSKKQHSKIIQNRNQANHTAKLASWASGGASEVDLDLPSFSPKTQSGFFWKDSTVLTAQLYTKSHATFTSCSLSSSSKVNSFFLTVLSWFRKLNSAAFFCNLANLFSYLETFFKVGLMYLPRKSFTAILSSVIS